MAYVIIDGGGLEGTRARAVRLVDRLHRRGGAAGIAGPLRMTIEHLEGVGGFGGLGLGDYTTVGGLGASDADQRSQLLASYLNTVGQWATMLQSVRAGLPSSTTGDQSRASIDRAQAQLSNSVIPIGQALILDTSVPLAQVVQRIGDFMDGYNNALEAQALTAMGAANHRRIAELTQAFKDGAVAIVAGGIDTARSALGIPTWALALGGLAAAAYIINSVR